MILERMGAVLHVELVRLRKKKKLTQEELAVLLGVTRSALSQYEIGTRNPDYETLQKIAEYFEVTTDHLLGMEQKEILNKEETQLDKDKKYALELFNEITDPDKKKAAIEVLKGLAGRK